MHFIDVAEAQNKISSMSLEGNGTSGSAVLTAMLE